jgi:predicted lipase
LTFIYTLFLPIPSAIKGSVQTVGLLQIIWLCQQHPNHPNLVDNVVEPTDNNLRQAGLVKVKLYNHTSATEHPIEDKLGVPTAQSDPTKGHSLKAISMTLHIFLVLIHLTLLGMLLSGRGSGFVFPFQLQNIVSFRIKLVANTIGIVCTPINYP